MASLLRKVKAKVDEARQGSNSHDLSQEEEANLVQKLAKEHPVEESPSQSVQLSPQPDGTPISDQFTGSGQPRDNSTAEKATFDIPSEKQENILGDSQPFRPGLVPNQGQQKPDAVSGSDDMPLPETPDQQAPQNDASQPEQQETAEPSGGSTEGKDELNDLSEPNTENQNAFESTQVGGIEARDAIEQQDPEDEGDKDKQLNLAHGSKEGADDGAEEADQEPRKQAYSSPDEANATVTMNDAAGHEDADDTTDGPISARDDSVGNPGDADDKAPVASQPADEADAGYGHAPDDPAEPVGQEEPTSKDTSDPHATDDTALQSAESENKEAEGTDQADQSATKTDEESKPDAPTEDVHDAAEDDEDQGESSHKIEEQDQDAEKQPGSANDQPSVEPGGQQVPSEQAVNRDGDAEKASDDEPATEKPTGDDVVTESPTGDGEKTSAPVKSAGSGKDDGMQERADQPETEQDDNMESSQAVRPGVKGANVAGPNDGKGGEGIEENNEELPAEEKDEDGGEAKPETDASEEAEEAEEPTAQDGEKSSEHAGPGDVTGTSRQDSGQSYIEPKEDAEHTPEHSRREDAVRDPEYTSKESGAEGNDDEVSVYHDSEEQHQAQVQEQDGAKDEAKENGGESQEVPAETEKTPDTQTDDHRPDGEETAASKNHGGENEADDAPKDDHRKHEANKDVQDGQDQGINNELKNETSVKPNENVDQPKENQEENDKASGEAKPSQEDKDSQKDENSHAGEAIAGGVGGAAALAGGAYEASKPHDDDENNDEQKSAEDEDKVEDGIAQQPAADEKARKSEGQDGETAEGPKDRSGEPENTNVAGDGGEKENFRQGDGDAKAEQLKDASFSGEPTLKEECSGNIDEPTVALNAQNKVREENGAQKLSWDDDLAEQASKHAQRLAESRKLQHSGDAEQGENVYVHVDDASYDDAVKAWLAEDEDYNGGRFGEGNAVRYRHFTQCVWHNTTHFGIAKAKSRNGSTFIVARYWPQGNIVGDKPF